MHYGCRSALGVSLQTSLELFILELGFTATDPFSISFQRYGHLVTDSWIKTIWEKCDNYKIEVTVRNVDLQSPREGDKWIMPILAAAGHSPEQLQRLNRVRLYQQALFLSDVTTASGRLIDPSRTQRRPRAEPWSRIRFPNQSPSDQDFSFWRESLLALHPIRGLGARIGPYRLVGHRVWEWWHDKEENFLLRCPAGAEFTSIYTQTG